MRDGLIRDSLNKD